MRIASVAFHGFGATPKTNWCWLAVTAEDGRVGWGECTLARHEAALNAEILGLDGALRGQDARDRNRHARLIAHAPGGLVRHAAVSALEQALCDLVAQDSGVPVVRLLGGAVRDDVRLYANINRAVSPRTPENFAAAASRAVAGGFTAVKLAPFEGLVWEDSDRAHWHKAYVEGLARIAAVRQAVPGAALMVDCHWRFSVPDAARLIRDLASENCWWVECPVSEAWLPELRRLRAMANDRGMRLAGAETLSGLAAYRPLIEAGAYDVLMPDIKYCGGHAEMQHIAALAHTAGIEVAPHNPTGPVCHAHSVHACLAMPNAVLLEVQLGESEKFFTAMEGVVPSLDGGRTRVGDAPGLGCAPRAEALAAHPWARVEQVWLDPRLG